MQKEMKGGGDQYMAINISSDPQTIRNAVPLADSLPISDQRGPSAHPQPSFGCEAVSSPR